MNTLPRFLAPFLFSAALLPAGCGESAPARAEPGKTEIAILGGGCFWCVEAVYEKVAGVTDVESGYAGGTVDNPTYEAICTGKTGHAEVIRITFDPSKITYAQILEVFRDIHDPTTLNVQGADRGTQYRSVIFYGDEAQRLAAEAWKKDSAQYFPNPIVTEISPLSEHRYWPAEKYHQDYFQNNPNQPYCAATIPPKLRKLFKNHSDKVAE